MNKDCPHCHKTFTPQALGTHIVTCSKRPEIAARVVECLADERRPGRAVTRSTYAARRKAYRVGQRPPCDDVLTAEYGKWKDVCRAYGLSASRDTQEVKS